MSTSMLSPLAAPFHPRQGEEMFGLVYNDGLPAASFVSGEHTVLHNIQDDALDEVFPPDAAEAAELDAAQDFVMTMAFLGLMVSCASWPFKCMCELIISRLSVMYEHISRVSSPRLGLKTHQQEEEEEMSRRDFSFARGKRWSARREIGLKGRPHPARDERRRDRSNSSTESETSIVPYDFVVHSYPANYDSRMRARLVARSNRQMTKCGKAMHGHSSHSIQQPRKSTFKNSTRLW